jgi:hypothetical protein
MRRVLLLSALLVSACAATPAATAPTPSGSSVTSTAPTTVATSTSAASPTPETWSKGEAGKRYLEMVGPANAAAKKAGEALDAERDLAGINRACKTAAKADDTFARALDAGKWPDDVRPLVDDLIESVTARRGLWLDCGNADTLEDALYGPGSEDPKPGSAQRLRVRLGLPANG